MKATIPAIPAFGDPNSSLTVGRAPQLDRLDVTRDHCVWRDGERVFCFTTEARAKDVARALDGVLRPRRK